MRKKQRKVLGSRNKPNTAYIEVVYNGNSAKITEYKRQGVVVRTVKINRTELPELIKTNLEPVRVFQVRINKKASSVSRKCYARPLPNSHIYTKKNKQYSLLKEKLDALSWGGQSPKPEFDDGESANNSNAES